MPFVGVSINFPLTAEQKSAAMAHFSNAVATALHKPEEYMMVTVQTVDLIYGKTTDPAAFVDIRSIGHLTDPNVKAASKAITDYLVSLGVAEDRIFISFADFPGNLWGYKGSTFS